MPFAGATEVAEVDAAEYIFRRIKMPDAAPAAPADCDFETEFVRLLVDQLPGVAPVFETELVRLLVDLTFSG